jgi:ADP-ribose pyrophosphatase
MDFRIEVIDNKRCFSGFLKLVRYRLRHSLFAGGWSPPLARERVEGLRAAVVLLYDPERDRLVLVEQFRIGALEEGRGAWLLEPVGGVVADGQDPAQVVMREAMEEAGCEVLALESVGTYYAAPGISDERIALYCGRVDAAAAGGIHGLADEGEDTRVLVLDAAQAAIELFSGKIKAASAIIAIQWLVANRERLRVAWCGGSSNAGPGPGRE